MINEKETIQEFNIKLLPFLLRELKEKNILIPFFHKIKGSIEKHLQEDFQNVKRAVIERSEASCRLEYYINDRIFYFKDFMESKNNCIIILLIRLVNFDNLLNDDERKKMCNNIFNKSNIKDE